MLITDHLSSATPDAPRSPASAALYLACAALAYTTFAAWAVVGAAMMAVTWPVAAWERAAEWEGVGVTIRRWEG